MLIESDMFIALLKERDRLKQHATNIMKRIGSGEITGAYASVASIQEVVFWLMREGKGKEIVAVVNALLNMSNIEWVQLDARICLDAVELMDEYRLGAFDAYHAATAITRDGLIMSSDHVFDRVGSIQRVGVL